MAGIARILQTFVGFFVVVVVLSHCVSSACLVFSDVAAKNYIPAQCQINRSLLPL